VADTRIQSTHRLNAEPAVSGSAARHGATVCPRCSEQFSSDGRFCPFDGEPLQALLGSSPRSSDALLGTVIDHRYEVCSRLGEGGMGVVYEVRHRALGKRFALKALRKDLAAEPEIAARFLQEARTAASVSHPGLVEITDFGRLASGQPFFVMELLEGQSLATLIRRGGPIPAGRAVDIVRQIAAALSAAHDLSIIHRDLKPDNIHVSADDQGRDRVTIVDFGLAKVIGASRLTRAGMVFGTPHYMSPEQAMGETTDHRSDIYALGIVMYEMFTGRVPFEADSYMGVLTKQMYMTPTPPSQLLGTNKLGALEDISLRCLEKKPEHRYGSLREFTEDLDRALSSTGGPLRVTRQRRPTPRSVLADALELPTRDEVAARSNGAGQRRWPRGPLLVVATFFLAGIGGMLALRHRGTAVRLPAEHALPTPQADSAPLGATGEASLLQPGRSAKPPPTAEALLTVQSHAEPSPAVPKSPNRKVPLASAHPAAGPVKKPTHLGQSSEIVDPWGK